MAGCCNLRTRWLQSLCAGCYLCKAPETVQSLVSVEGSATPAGTPQGKRYPDSFTLGRVRTLKGFGKDWHACMTPAPLHQHLPSAMSSRSCSSGSTRCRLVRSTGARSLRRINGPPKLSVTLLIRRSSRIRNGWCAGISPSLSCSSWRMTPIRLAAQYRDHGGWRSRRTPSYRRSSISSWA